MYFFAGVIVITSYSIHYTKLYDYATAGDDITSVNLDGRFNGLVSTIANQIGANKGAKLVVNFKDMATAAAAGDSTPSYNQTITFSSASTEDFGIMLNNSSKLTKAAVV